MRILSLVALSLLALGGCDAPRYGYQAPSEAWCHRYGYHHAGCARWAPQPPNLRLRFHFRGDADVPADGERPAPPIAALGEEALTS